MLLGNAILRVARLDQSVRSTAAATVTLDGIELDCEDCRWLALKYGDRLEVREQRHPTVISEVGTPGGRRVECGGEGAYQRRRSDGQHSKEIKR